jgi:hypothetical protein
MRLCMARTLFASLLLVAALAAARGALAQPAGDGQISDPPATFRRPVSAFDSSPVASLTGVSADPMDSHVFEFGWWYRIAGDDRERPLPNPDDSDYVGDTSTITWNDVHGRGFRAVETAVVVNGGGPSGQVTFSLTLTNLSATAPVDIDVFNMTDIDLGFTTENDAATLLIPNERIGITDPPDSAEYGAADADAFLVMTAEYTSGLPDVAARLSDAVLDNFDNSGLPFDPGDFSAGFQWSTKRIPPGGSATFVAGIAVNMPLAFPGGATTTTTTITTTTTTTTLATDVCGNCSDDDGDGLVDFDDPDCCTATAMTLRKSSIRPRGTGTATLKLTAKLAASPVADGTDATQDVTVQLSGAGGTFCGHIPTEKLVRRRKGLTFRDADGTLAGAGGIQQVKLIEKRNGAKLVVFGRAAQLDSPPPGQLTATIGLRDHATAEAANQCTAATETFRAGKRGVRYP